MTSKGLRTKHFRNMLIIRDELKSNAKSKRKWSYIDSEIQKEMYLTMKKEYFGDAPFMQNCNRKV